MQFSELKKSLRKDFSGLPEVKLAVLADSATQFLVQAVRGTAYNSNYNFNIYEGDYGQISQQICDPSSELYRFAPEIVLVLHSSEKLQERFYKKDLAAQKNFADDVIAELTKLFLMLKQQGRARIIFSNFPEIDDAVYGNNANKYATSFMYVVRKINLALMELAQEQSLLSIVDFNAMQGRMGRAVFADARLYVDASMVYSLDALPVIARHIVDMVLALRGVFKKCLIVDLDHTLWGGVIGDDGIEKIEIGDFGVGKAYTALQHWIKQLKMRGILIAVCSKNTEHVAKEPFEKHADMVLRLDDISVFVANWDNKADNIRTIQAKMNIGFDSMVFIDDNSFERNLVRNALPQVTVPELPEDPVEYVGYLQSLNLFEAGTLTEQDFERTQQIQNKVKLDDIQRSFANEAEFLQDMEMVCTVSGFTAYNTPRVAQLSQRSNQYNLRTLRYVDEDIQAISKDASRVGLALGLRDKLCDHGLIAVVILHEVDGALFIENWFMSCRVLKRGMERLIINMIVRIAKQRGVSFVRGEYIPTPKNELVKNHYKDLAFNDLGDNKWELSVGSFTEQQHFIREEATQ